MFEGLGLGLGSGLVLGLVLGLGFGLELIILGTLSLYYSMLTTFGSVSTAFIVCSKQCWTP